MVVTAGIMLSFLLPGAVCTTTDPAEVFVIPNFHPASCGWLTDWSTERNYYANDYTLTSWRWTR